MNWERMTADDTKDEAFQLELFGISCPFCGQSKTHLVTMLFREGLHRICEDCRKVSTVADWYQPPSIRTFKRRLSVKTASMTQEGWG